jgi:membrane protease YdiL (CAAX protease family)
MEDSSTGTPNKQPFLSLSDLGKNEWYRYLLSIFVILVLWQILGAVPYAFVYILDLTDNLYLSYITQSFSFLCFLGAIYFAVKTIHRRPILSVMTPGSTLNWKLIFFGAGLWLFLSIWVTVGDVLLHPGTYRWAFDFRQWLPFVLTALILTPIQTTAEEWMFRGYLLQGMGRITRNKTALIILSGLIFAVPHFLNPEMQIDFVLLALFYFSFGAFLTWMTLKYQSLELAMGVHAANNLFTVVIANYEGSALQSPALFIASGLDPVYSLLSFLAAALIFGLFIPKMIHPDKREYPTG